MKLFDKETVTPSRVSGTQSKTCFRDCYQILLADYHEILCSTSMTGNAMPPVGCDILLSECKDHENNWFIRISLYTE